MADERSPTERMSKRLSDGLDGISERIDAGFGSLRSAVDDLADHVRRGDARNSAKFEAQEQAFNIALRAVETGIGDLRDRVVHLEETAMPAALARQAASMSEGAARGAGEAAGAVASAAAAAVAAHQRKPVLQSWSGRVIATALGFVAIVTALGAIPKVIKYGGMLLAWLGGLK